MVGALGGFASDDGAVPVGPLPAPSVPALGLGVALDDDEAVDAALFEEEHEGREGVLRRAGDDAREVGRALGERGSNGEVEGLIRA